MKITIAPNINVKNIYNIEGNKKYNDNLILRYAR